MARSLSRILPAALALTLTLAIGAARSARAEGAASDGGSAAGDKPRSVPEVAWHDTYFIWDHSATTETLGIGKSYQSRNPTYEMTFRLAPRFYLVDDAQRSLSLRADVRLIREFTNSDTTTREGEWTFADTELWLAGVQTLRNAPGQKTELSARAPVLVLPTSKTSASGGRVLGLGAGLGLDQQVPLRGAKAGSLPGMLFRARAGYTYQFVSTIVPTNDRIDRVRLDPEGQTLPSDQLNGSAFPQHELSATLRTELDIVERLDVTIDLGLRYAYRYALPDATVCGVLDTGCSEVPRLEDASRWSVATLFGPTVRYYVTEFMQLGLGYANLAPQLGADGRRRSFFYSPYARASLSMTVVLDGLYHHVRDEAPPEAQHLSRREPAPRW